MTLLKMPNIEYQSSKLRSGYSPTKQLLQSAELIYVSTTVDKLADYEDELRQLKASSNQHPANKMNPTAESLPIPHNTPQVQDPPLSIVNARSPLQSRLSSLLPSRRATSQPPSSAPPHQHSHDPQNTTDLLTALTREQHLRQVAESRISQTNDELEELSAQLFQEANEMVATERKARAKLEERVALLERRDGEKRKRLEVLEGRMGRIERVRELLKEEES
ncbi:hypothetical protein MMC12_006710 [Toensbergia leucococca]|nr:hypothetical protein [Toensbergia leucococca]